MQKKKTKLLIPATLAPAGWDVLNKRTDIESIRFELSTPTQEFHSLLADVFGIALGLTRFAAPEVAAAPQLRVVSRIGVGYDNVDVPALSARKIALMVTGTANSPSVAEKALYFMLELAKRGSAMNAMVREGRWAERFNDFPLDLYGKTALVVGFGRIGSRISRMCLALGMEVLVYDPYVDQGGIADAGCQSVSDLDSALGQADFVTIHCPRNGETNGLFDAARIARMKRSAYLINTARGGIVDEAALHLALNERTIAGAGLDVYDVEPPAPDNALPGSPYVVNAPHVAGVTREALDRMCIATVQNLLDVLDGKPNPDHVVNKEVMAGR